jgi:hypothetical protein
MVRVACGKDQILCFVEQKPGVQVEHSDYHVSVYVDDFKAMFMRMQELNLIFVNPRFKRKASTLDEASLKKKTKNSDLEVQSYF